MHYLKQEHDLCASFVPEELSGGNMDNTEELAETSDRKIFSRHCSGVRQESEGRKTCRTDDIFITGGLRIPVRKTCALQCRKDAGMRRAGDSLQGLRVWKLKGCVHPVGAVRPRPAQA